jgi:hypothetical protein
MFQLLHQAVIERKRQTSKLTDRIHTATKILGLMMRIPGTDPGRVQMAAALLTSACMYLDETGFERKDKERFIGTFANATKMVEELRDSMN